MSLVRVLKEHETTIVETAAVLTASTRWVITFSPIDRTDLDGIIAAMGWAWDAISAVLSISFAVVEIWATAMIMRAFNVATSRKDKFFLGAVWTVSLIVLAMVQIPPLYASLMGVPVASLGGWAVLYVVAASVAAFVVIAGVSYSDRVKPTQRVTPVQEEAHIPPVKVGRPRIERKDGERIAVSGYDEFRARMSAMNGQGPKSGADVERAFAVSRKTAYRWWNKYIGEKVA